MRITKKWLREQRGKLMVRVRVLAKMTHGELLADIKVNTGWDASRATIEELRAVCLSWAVRDYLPDSMCE